MIINEKQRLLLRIWIYKMAKNTRFYHPNNPLFIIKTMLMMELLEIMYLIIPKKQIAKMSNNKKINNYIINNSDNYVQENDNEDDQ